MKHNSRTRHRRWHPHQVMLLLLCSYALSLLTACGGDDTVYASFTDIPAEGWQADEYCDFPTAEYDSTLFRDTTAKYDIILAIRHTDRYPFSDLSLFIDQADTIAHLLPDTLTMQLASASGQWIGTRSKGIYLQCDTLAHAVALPPLFAIKVRHNMPGDALQGLLGIGLIINKSN